MSLFKVKVWFQNRRMKWKRVKGGQQGAAAREKELVNVKKGTLLPSELSGIGAATLQQTGDSLANDDSHDSDHSSEHAHLWYTQWGPAPFSGKKCCDGKPYSNIVYTERWLWQWFLKILLHADISSQFLMISRGFNTKCHLLKMLPRWRWRRWTRFEYSRCVGGVWQRAGMFAFACTENGIAIKSKLGDIFIPLASRMKMQKMHLLRTFQTHEVMCMTVGRYRLLLALTIKLLSRIKHETFLSWTTTVPEITLKWIKKNVF